MSERVANKLKQLTVVKKTSKERFQALCDARQVENFTLDELRELYGKNSMLLLQLYQEFVSTADQEASTKGKLLTTQEASALVQVLKDLMQFNSAKITQTEWELKFFEKEVLCFLHQECHATAKRNGFEALALLIDIRCSSPSAPFEERQTWLQCLLSALDWEYLRSSYGNFVSLPSWISEVRKGRHDCVPPRSRVTTAGSEEREKECLAMLKRVVVDPFATKETTPEALSFWLKALFEHIAPLFLPQCSQKAGLIDCDTLHGFLQGVHKKIHSVFVDLIHSLTTRPELIGVDRMARTIGSTVEGTRFVFWALVECVRDPSIELISSSVKALSCLVTFVKQYTVISGTGGSKPVQILPLAHECGEVILHDLLSNNTAHLVVAFLLPMAEWIAIPVPVFQTVVESFVELFFVVAATPLSGITIPQTTKETAVSRLAMLASELASLNLKRPSSVIDDVIGYATQAFWAAVMSVVPPSTTVFSEKILPIVQGIEKNMTSLPPASPPPYLIKCWVHLVVQHVKVFIAPPQGKLMPYAWPAGPLVSQATGNPSTSALLEFRVRRTSIGADLITKKLAQMMCSEPQSVNNNSSLAAEPPLAESAAFVACSEAIHSTLQHYDTDSYITQKAKGQCLFDALRLFCDAIRSGNIVLEPDSLLKVVAPYLILQSHLTESPNAVVSNGSFHASQGQNMPHMSPVARDALENICEIISLASSERYPSMIDSLYDDGDSVGSAAPLNPVVLVVLLDRCRDVLQSVRNGKLEGDDVESRMITQLFKGNTTSMVGRPTSFLLTNEQLIPLTLLDEIFAASLRLLVEKERPKQTQVSFLDAKASALNALLWSFATDRRPEVGSLAERLRRLLAAIRTMIQQGKYPSVQLVKLLSALITQRLRARTDAIDGESDRESFHDEEPLLLELLEILLAHWNVLERNSSQLYASVMNVIETLEDLFRHYQTIKQLDEENQGGVDEDTRPAASRKFLFQVYQFTVTALAGATLYHTYNWIQSRSCGDALLQLVHLLAEVTTRIGYLRIISYNRDSTQYAVPLVQLLADVVEMTQVGTTRQKYAVGVPASSKEYCCSVSAVESAYQLMRDGLEAQAMGYQQTSINSSLVMIPPQDESARRWIGSSTPHPTEVQVDTLLPQQVANAGLELLDSLFVHVAGFPLPDPHCCGFEDQTPKDSDGIAERRSVFRISKSQILSVESRMLEPEVIFLRSASVLQSSGWIVRPPVYPTQENCTKSAEATATLPLIQRKAAVLTTTLEGHLEDFAGSNIPPRELVEDASDDVYPPITLATSSSAASSLVAFTKVRPPFPTDDISLPKADKNYSFSFMLSAGLLDGCVPADALKKLTNPHAAVLGLQGLHPPEGIEPIAFSANDLDELDQISTRSLAPQLHCIIRAAPNSSKQSELKLQQVAQEVLSSFGAADDEGLSFRFCAARHELIVREIKTIHEAFHRSDSILCFANTFHEVQQILKEIRHLLSGRSFTALFAVPNATIAETLTVYLARQGEGAPHFAPIMDGMCISTSAFALTLRSAMLTSTIPWRQPTTMTEAKRRTTQRAGRAITIQSIPTVVAAVAPAGGDSNASNPSRASPSNGAAPSESKSLFGAHYRFAF